MILQSLTFYLFSSVAVLSALMVISAKNPVHSVLFLILSFVNASGLFVLLGAEFLAMILVVVYVGAVAVLFLFVVMMLDINFVKLREGFLQYLPFGALLGIVLVIELGILYLTDTSSNINYNQTSLEVKINDLENTKMIGQLLYTKYFYLFQICGIILLVAMIGSITLTLRDKGQVKRQNINFQNTLDASNAIEKKQAKLGEGIQ
ncbi:MAG: NADH:ubiquinone oxidoreductase subunit J [Pelagibacteraceae bacterium TMED237]|nr:MAG: NADH:ubiquinone oxidoreductase subunit J [Pelagibacteraceae bacterium TMED237]